MKSEPTYFPVEMLLDHCKGVLRAVGMPADEADLVADTLVWANLSGTDSHGVNRLATYARRIIGGGIVTPAKLEPVSSTAAVGVLDAGFAAGQVAAARAMDDACARAREFGLGAMAVRRSNHFGAAGYFTALAAERGYIGLIFSGATARMPAWGGRERLLGNNPWSIAVPTSSGTPVVLDMGNSVVALGKIRNALARGEQIPLGWALDGQGQPTTDPAAAIEGSLNFMGDHKGYGISVLVDLIGPTLASAASGPEITGIVGADDTAQGLGHLAMALDPKAFDPSDAYPERVDAYAERLRSSLPAPWADAVHLPGDPEAASRARRSIEGVPLPVAVVAELRAIGAQCGVPLPV